ncbi:tetratricopeptide repeat protein [Alteromonadaceae bacterium M269]|nr:tetratricopeptide repeat protein [Alteromonadaceae bacterium M269]
MGGHVMGTMQNGKGIMIFSNSSTPQRNPAIDTMIENIVRVLDWEKPLSKNETSPTTKIKDKLVGRYLSAFDQIVTIEQADDKLTYRNPLTIGGKSFEGELFYQGHGQFALPSHSNLLSVEINPEDNKPYITFHRQGTDLKSYAMRKLAVDEVLPFEVAESGSIEESLAAYESWYKQHPRSRLLAPNMLNNQGYVALSKQDYKAAINFLTVYATFHSNDANAFDSLGEAYMLKGDKALAVKHYQKSLSLNPNNDNAKQMLAKLKR